MSRIKVERRPSPERLQELGVAQAFQPVLAQAKVCGYKNNPLIATRYNSKWRAVRTLQIYVPW